MTTLAGVRALSNTPSDQLTHRQRLVIFSGLMFGMVLGALDTTIVATALPTMVGDLGGLDHISWVVTAYLLTATITSPLYGKLGDLYGRRPLYQAAIAVFLVGSVLCGLAPGMGAMIAARALQGCGAGGLVVLSQAIIADVVSPRERGRYQGMFGAAFGAATVVGPLAGGFLTDHLSWRWVFYVNLPIGALALLVTGLVLPRSLRRPNVRVDLAGAALLSVAIASVVLVTSWGGVEHAWGSPVIVGLGTLAVVTGAAFVVVERRVPEPLLPLSLFRFRAFCLAGAVAVLLGVSMFGAINFLPLFVQVVNDVSATSSGVLLIPLMGGMVLTSVTTGNFVSRTGHYRAFPIAGTVVNVVGVVSVGLLGAASGRLASTVSLLLIGCAYGLTMQVMIVATQNEVPRSELGVATSTINFFRSIGGALGVALIGAMFTSRLVARVGDVARDGALDPGYVDTLAPAARQEYVERFAEALAGTFWYVVPLALAAVLCALAVRERPLRESVRAEGAVALE
ncbi:MAG: MDR family MFS transporter [Acidimicrobiia bacterium]